MDDEQIITLFFDRSENAISQVSGRYGPLCRSIAMNLLRDPQDADECLNDTWHALWETIPPEHPNPLSAYIARITRNIALKKLTYLNAAKRTATLIPFEELSGCIADGTTLDEHLQAKELAQLLDRFLDTLDRDNRAIFLRRYWFFDSVQEIAKGFGISQSNVKSRLFRMRNQLKKYLQEAQNYV